MQGKEGEEDALARLWASDSTSGDEEIEGAAEEREKKKSLRNGSNQ